MNYLDFKIFIQLNIYTIKYHTNHKLNTYKPALTNEEFLATFEVPRCEAGALFILLVITVYKTINLHKLKLLGHFFDMATTFIYM